MQMWVITCSVNDYRQHGDYFIGVFSSKEKAEENCPADNQSDSYSIEPVIVDQKDRDIYW